MENSQNTLDSMTELIKSQQEIITKQQAEIEKLKNGSDDSEESGLDNDMEITDEELDNVVKQFRF